ncbi:hypothetical protein MtrunA17_Chr2g0288081 [Medicago truncatula]|uniref:Uncharacterized protein n=1 Tax=Medicago truncatula TaxID=3880 RepID=A0A396JBE3_MEDTR|nr:hypothetical protein MtrunA17_Chr2g0288081 [Medicago truncatula]
MIFVEMVRKKQYQRGSWWIMEMDQTYLIELSEDILKMRLAIKK